MKFPPVRTGYKGERPRGSKSQQVRDKEDVNRIPDFHPTFLRDKVSKSPEPIGRLATQQSSGEKSGQSPAGHQSYCLRRTKSNDINPGQAYSPSQRRTGGSAFALDTRAAQWKEKKAPSHIQAFIHNHPAFRASVASTFKKEQDANSRAVEHAQTKATSKTKRDNMRITKAQILQDHTSTSSSCSSQSASQPSWSGSRSCSIPKDVLHKFGLSSNKKPAMFDKEEELKGTGISVRAAAVSYGGRTNWNWKKENQDTFLMECSEKNDLVLLAVFDGHGINGGVASADVRDQLLESLRKPDGLLWNHLKQDPEKAMKDSFAEIDSSLCRRQG